MSKCVGLSVVNGVETVVADDTCAAGLVLVDANVYAAMASNPLLIPLDAGAQIAWASFGLLLTCYLLRISRRALD